MLRVLDMSNITTHEPLEHEPYNFQRGLACNILPEHAKVAKALELFVKHWLLLFRFPFQTGFQAPGVKMRYRKNFDKLSKKHRKIWI